MCGSKNAMRVETPSGAAERAFPVITTAAALNTCGSVVCTHDFTSRGKTPGAAGSEPTTGHGERKCESPPRLMKLLPIPAPNDKPVDECVLLFME